VSVGVSVRIGCAARPDAASLARSVRFGSARPIDIAVLAWVPAGVDAGACRRGELRPGFLVHAARLACARRSNAGVARAVAQQTATPPSSTASTRRSCAASKA